MTRLCMIRMTGTTMRNPLRAAIDRALTRWDHLLELLELGEPDVNADDD